MHILILSYPPEKHPQNYALHSTLSRCAVPYHSYRRGVFGICQVFIYPSDNQQSKQCSAA